MTAVVPAGSSPPAGPARPKLFTATSEDRDPPGHRQIIQYGAGVLDNAPDKPGQAAARKKVFGFPLELVLPGYKVKALAETLGGADLPPFVHREDGGRGTGTAERDAIARDNADRLRAQAEKDAKRMPPISTPPVGGAFVQAGGNAPNAAQAIVLGVQALGIRGAIERPRVAGLGLELAAILPRIGAGRSTSGPRRFIGAAAVSAAINPEGLGGGVAMGSFHPQLVEPVNEQGIRNGGAQKGIGKELVHERADP